MFSSPHLFFVHLFIVIITNSWVLIVCNGGQAFAVVTYSLGCSVVPTLTGGRALRVPRVAVLRYDKTGRDGNDCPEGRHFSCSQILGAGGMEMPCRAAGRSTQAYQEAEQVRGKCGNLYCSFHGKEWARQGKQA